MSASGYYGDESGTGSSLYVYLKHSTDARKAPGMHMVKALPTTTVRKSHVKDGDANTGTPIDFHQLKRMVERGITYLGWPFRALATRPRDMVAMIKYCFVLAAESRLYGYEEHSIPLVGSFSKDLRSACLKIRKHGEERPKFFAEPGQHDRIVRITQVNLYVPNRATYNSGDAAIHTEGTGIADLDQLASGLLRKTEKLNASSAPPVEPTYRRSEASKRHPKHVNRQDGKRSRTKAYKNLAARVDENHALGGEAAQLNADEHIDSNSPSTEDMPKRKKPKLSQFSNTSKQRPVTSVQAQSLSVRRTRSAHIPRTKSIRPELLEAYLRR
jgi:hypothetical protein